MSGVYNIVSLIALVISFVTGIISILKGKVGGKTSLVYSGISYSMLAIVLFTRILSINELLRIKDFSALDDLMEFNILVSLCSILVIVFINAVSLTIRRK